MNRVGYTFKLRLNITHSAVGSDPGGAALALDVGGWADS